MVGTHRVGSLLTEDSAIMRPVFEAAAQFQELPQLQGVLQALDLPFGTTLTAHMPAPFPPLPTFQ
jgi:hypothetical protein